MTPEQLADAIAAAVRAELAGRGHPELPATVELERPRNPEHGDYASNVALQLAAAAGTSPRELASAIAARLEAVAEVEVAGPGFLNFRIPAAGGLPALIAGQGAGYGGGTALAGQRINLEFVSANPTGPVTLGSARWAAVGDALARLLRGQGAVVQTEYYFNDAGAQIGKFAASLLAAARHEPVPADGYQGDYIAEIAAAITARTPDAARRPDALEVFRAEGVALMLAEIKTSLAAFGVGFDTYFSEQTLHDRNELAAALARLREVGHVYEADGATWVVTSAFGDDKDRVFRRSDGAYSYFAADCAYYLDKRSRGAGLVMIILGADHHGYVGRLRAMAACFGDDPDATLEVLIGQLVSLLRDGQPVRLSKRAGNVVTLGDLVAAIGVDAARYALARYSIDSPIDIDLDLWARRSSDNPVFYVQYAHARICSLLRTAAAAGLPLGSGYDPALLRGEQESDLLRDLADFPAVLASAASLREPHRVARYAERLAGSYHRFYDACRVLPRPGEDMAPELSLARLWLAEATRIVLANGLRLLGVSAPEQM
ncbi:MAG TPA: arginine--tRNA ligase [Streptosporangiaceae bacterium]|nr:arginine--tRNA ligase [Streptosporangiaceae bacterium]